MKKPELSRLSYIDRTIRDGVFPNSATLARELEVSGRTIKRDLEFLKDMQAAPIEYDYTRRGYYYTEPNYRLPAISISESELFALTLAEKVLEQYEGTPLYGTLRSVFRKIEDFLPDRVSLDPSVAEGRFSFGHMPAARIDKDVWMAVFASLREEKTLNFEYRVPPHAEYLVRRLDPYHVICRKGDWYAVGRCHRSGEIRIFSLARMRNAGLIEDRFFIPPDFDIRKYADPSMGAWVGKGEYKIKVEFDPKAARYILERDWQDGHSVSLRRGGRAVLEFSTNQLQETLWWVLSWGKSARVIGPRELVDMIRLEANAIIEMYGR